MSATQQDVALYGGASIYDCMPTSVTASPYSTEQRIQAVMTFLTTGNHVKTSELIGIPHRTLCDWSKKEWWEQAIAIIRVEKAQEFDAMLSNIVEEGFVQAHDRLLKGNHAYDKDGEYKGRQEMSGRDIGTLTGIMYDKLRIHRNMPTSISSNGGTDAKLESLAQKMVELSAKHEASVVSEQSESGEIEAESTK